MSEIIAIVGESGSGKSTSLRNLDPKTTFVIATKPKRLPFPRSKELYVKFEADKLEGNYFVTSKYSSMLKLLDIISTKMPHIKTIVFDDFQYLLADEFMERAEESGWGKFTELAKHAWLVLDRAQKLREDLKIFFLMHEENIAVDGAPKKKIKTIGKLLDEKITLEGLFSVVLFTHVHKDVGDEFSKFYFTTQSDGVTTAKSPMGMFETFKIDNDLKMVVDAFDNY